MLPPRTVDEAVHPDCDRLSRNIHSASKFNETGSWDAGRRQVLARLALMPPTTDKPGTIMLASIIALIVVFLLAGFWLRYHKTAPTPSIKGTPVSSQ